MARAGRKVLSRQRGLWLINLTLDEITHANTQALGVPLLHPQTGDKRLRALCEAVMRAPSARATLADWALDAGASGYASDSAFSAMFKTAMGQSPSHFQNRHRLQTNRT